MLDGKQSVNVTRSTGTNVDCSYMDKDSQFNMIVLFLKMIIRKAQGVPQ